MSKMITPRKLHVAVIREELVALTGDMQSAVCLGQMLYWAERTSDTDSYIMEEQKRDPSSMMEPTHGWIYKTANELNEETMLGASESTIGRRLKGLVDAGWLRRRRNPRYKWDKTWQYRPDLQKIVNDLAVIGCALSGYSLGDPQSYIDDSPTYQDDTPICHSDTSIYRPDRAIPETTIEITSETTSEQPVEASAADIKVRAQIVRRAEHLFGLDRAGIVAERINEMLEDHSEREVLKAFDKAVDANAANWHYIEVVLGDRVAKEQAHEATEPTGRVPQW